MRLLMVALGLAVSLVQAAAATDAAESDIAKYKCSEFLQDVLQQKDGSRLLRSMMVIAWSTGYAAAYQKDNTRADPEAFRLISAMLAAECVKNPSEAVVKAAVGEIHNLFSEPK